MAYRTRKFVARHRAALFWIAALLSIAVATLPAVVSERLRTAREASRAEQVEQLLANMFAFATPRATQPPTASLYVDHAAGLVQTELAAQPHSQARLLLVMNAQKTIRRGLEILGVDAPLRMASLSGLDGAAC